MQARCCFLALVALLFLASATKLAGAVGSDRRAACADAVSALEEALSAEDRRFLQLLCAHGDDKSPEWFAAFRKEGRFERLVTRLSSRDEWEIRVLFNLLPLRLFEPSHHDVACRGRQTLAELVRRAGGSASEQLSPAAYASAIQSALRQNCSVRPAPPTGSARGGATRANTAGRVPLFVVAPPQMQVRVLSLDGDLSFEVLPRATIPTLESPNIAVYATLVRYRARYLVAIEPMANEPTSLGSAVPSESLDRTILRGNAFRSVESVSTDSLKLSCMDLRVKADGDLRVLLDGVQIDMERDGRLYRAVREMVSENRDQHRLTIFLGAEASSVVNRAVSLESAPDDDDLCQELSFDLTTSVQDDTVGLLDVDAEACIEAGIDTPRLLSYVKSYMEVAGRRVKDLRSWSVAAQYLADLRKTLRELGGNAVGADRGRLDSMRSLGTGAEELLRQGFSSLLLTDLRCSRRSLEGWDYSFMARHIDLKKLREQSRDPISGIDMDDIEQTSIELVNDRAELGPRIDGVLGKLLRVPTLVVAPLPSSQPYVERIRAVAEVYLPEQATKQGEEYVVSLAARRLSSEEAQDVCPRIADMHRLRVRRDFSNLDRGTWRQGPKQSFEVHDRVAHVALEMEPDSSSTVLVRTSLGDAAGGKRAVASSYTCVDLSRDGAELWSEIGGWFPLGSTTPARTEESRAFNAAIGVDWQQPSGWLSIGSGIGFSYTTRSGSAPSSWAGLGQAKFDADGTLPYTIRENAVYILLHAQARGSICQAWWPEICSSATRRTMLTARLMALPGIHIVSLEDVDQALTEFTQGATVNTVVDLGLLLQPGFAVQFSETMTFNGRLSFGTHRLFDFLSRSAGEADVYRRAIWGTSIGVAWDF
jgi:hypothetical protein